VAGNELFPGDLVTTKVWLDRHVFNDTLKSKLSPAGHKIFVMSEDKVLTQGLAWPPKFKPTLCFVGLGRASLEMYVALHQLFPDLRIVLLDVQDLAYLVIAAKELDVDVESLATASLDDFVEGVERCNVIQWSLDSPAFSFFKYRDLFYSTPYILGLFNLQGCNPPWRLNGIPVDRYYCEYLYQGFKATICGKVNENNFADYMGQELYFPMVDAGCGENICLCHAHSDAYIDFHLELLCRYEGHKQFMGQWGQDEFLVENVFGKNDLRGEGIYVDVGSSHPYHLSNTAYLDTCLNWRGVCMEPNPRLKHIIRGVRTCSVIDACAWANKTTMKFANGLELAARTDAAELKPSTPGEIEEDTHPSETFFEARCDSLHQLMLEGLGQLLNHSEVADILENRKKPRVDLLSVDAEGSELEIFKDFPFEVWDIRCIVVETSRRTSMAMDSLLLPMGFIKVAVLGKDAVYATREQLGLFPQELKLPRTINWNEPGSDSDTIEYTRFQRLFGVEGDLDEDVGDQRLLNESELERQGVRQEAKESRMVAEAMNIAKTAYVGGIVKDDQKSLLEDETVKQILGDPQVKRAMILMHQDYDRFFEDFKSNTRLQVYFKQLLELGLMEHDDLADFLKNKSQELRSLDARTP